MRNDDPFGLLQRGLSDYSRGERPKAAGGRAAPMTEPPFARPRWADDEPAVRPVASVSERLEFLDICDECGADMRITASGFTCPACGNVSELAFDQDETFGRTSSTVESRHAPCRMRVIGPGCGYFQRGLDGASVETYAETQKQTVLNEYMTLNRKYRERGGNAFSTDVLTRAAEMYHSVQKMYVRRDQKKLKLMAACLKIACLAVGFARSVEEIASCIGLKNKGIASGEDFLRKMHSRGEFPIDLEKLDSAENICAAHATTTLANLGMVEGDAEGSSVGRQHSMEYRARKTTIIDLVHRAIDENVANYSNISSKVVGATFVVLVRSGDSVDFPNFCSANSIRPHTVKKFVSALSDFHSRFADIFQVHGLDDRHPDLLPALKKISR